MAHSWSVAGGVVTLTLDGTESGQISRSRTLTGLEFNQLYTFYLVVNPTAVPVNAFFQVVGGDTTVATVAGSQTLKARGTTDGSGTITLRWGVQNADAAPFVHLAVDFGDYADTDALLADWTIVPASNMTWSLVTPAAALTSPRVPQVLVNGNITAGALSALQRSFGGFTPGNDVRVRWWQYENEDNPHGTANTWAAANDTTVAATGGGEVPVSFEWGQVSTAYMDNKFIQFDRLTLDEGDGGPATVQFSALTSCIGSGLSETGGTGAGPDGDDPLPDVPIGGYPPPAGTRPFGCSSIPASGLGYWDSVIKRVRADWVANLLNTARTAGAKLYLVFGQTEDWVDSAGVFSYARWQATVDAVYNNTTARALIQSGIDDGTFIAHYVIDEPHWKGRWGKVIPLSDLDQMCTYSKTLWSSWTTAIRTGPTTKVDGGAYYVTRHINNLNWLWAQYTQRFGDVTTYRNDSISRAQALGHGVVMGLNIADILGANTRPITPAELEYYGGILTSSSVPQAFYMWQYESGLYAQAGFEASLAKVRTNWESYDP